VNVFDLAQPIRLVYLERELAGDVWDLAAPDGPVVASSNVMVLDSQCQGSATRAKIQINRPDFSLWMFCARQPTLTAPGLEIQGQFNAEFGVYEAFGRFAFPERKLEFRKRREGKRFIWEADVAPGLLDGLRDLLLTANYQGACARAYLNGNLISDHYFGRFLVWELGLRDWLQAEGTLRLEFEDTIDVDLKVVPSVETEVQIEWT
jgi:hypothetical protein